MIELNRIINADCMDIMKTIPDKYFELAIVDPPYGIGEDGGRFRDRKGGGHRILPKKDWDSEIPNEIYFDELCRISENQIIWGGNYFTDYLYQSKGWIYWRKLMGGDFSDGELAWSSFDRALREFTHCNKHKGKFHPTQKPVALYKWLLKNYAKEGDKIIDTHSGSGTTAIACIDRGFEYLCIEKDKEYFEKSVERVNKELIKINMFD